MNQTERLCKHRNVTRHKENAISYCEDCGVVLDTTELIPAEEPGEGQTYVFPTESYDKDRHLLLLALTNIFGMNSFFPEITAVLKQALDSGLGASGRKGKLVCAASVYLVIRRHSRAVSIAEIAAAIQESPFVLGRVFLKLIVVTNEPRLANMDPILLLERYWESCVVFFNGHESSENARSTTLDLASEILEFAKSKWLDSGRRPQYLALAALTLAIDAFRKEQDAIARKLIAKVAPKIGLTVSTTVLRLKEIEEALLTQLNVLPWAEDVNSKNLHLNVQDIMAFSRLKVQSDSKSLPPSLIRNEDQQRQRLDQVKRAQQRLLLISNHPNDSITDQLEFSDLAIERLLLRGKGSSEIVALSDKQLLESVLYYSSE